MLIQIATHTDPLYPHIRNFATRLYEKKLGAKVCADPDAFAYASLNSSILGCFGLYLAEMRPLQLEAYVATAFATLSGDPAVPRTLCAELGTRAIERNSKFSSKTISVALCARILLYAHERGIRYFGFTANRTSLFITKELDLETIYLGQPDLSGMTESFKQNWSRFFSIDQYCFGFRINSTERCTSKLMELEKTGLYST